MAEYTLEDGRKAVKVENKIDPMTKVIEVYVEPKLEKKLTQRVIEKFGVVERITETVDEKTGKVVDRHVEKVAGQEKDHFEVVDKKNSLKSPMQLVVEEKLKSNFDSKTYVFVAIVVVQLLVLGYVALIM